MNITTHNENQEESLLVIMQTLLPWLVFDEQVSLNAQTTDDNTDYLGQFYLFPIAEISVANSIEDIAHYIQTKYQTVLAAAYSAQLSIATVICGEKGKISLMLGIKSNIQKAEQVFGSLVRGAFPGGNTHFDKTRTLDKLIKQQPHGGVITGLPSLKHEDEKQKFNIASVVRSMYGHEYTLMILAEPVLPAVMTKQLNQLLDFRDKSHAIAVQTANRQESKSVAYNEQTTEGKNSGHNIGGSVNYYAAVPMVSGVGGSITYSYAFGSSTSKAKGKTDTSGETLGLSYERQNGLAIELEKVADSLVQRTIQGLNTGFWETVVTFATANETTRDILAGSFAGELSKPSKQLYPPKVYKDTITGNKRLLFIPKQDTSNSLFPKSLASYISSEELAQLASFPTETLPGFEIKKMPSLALTDIVSQKLEDSFALGAIADYGEAIAGSAIHLSKGDLNKHLFVCGITGSGKTTTVNQILKSAYQQFKTPFLVLESAKRDYRQLLADEAFKDDLKVFTVGDTSVSPIAFNPFYVQKGVKLLVHIDYLKSIFNASFSFHGPMPNILEQCLHNVYRKKGWNLTSGKHPFFQDSEAHTHEEHYYCFPTLADLKHEVQTYIKDSGYEGEFKANVSTGIVTRLESLCVGAKGLMFNTHDFYAIPELLSNPTILEMEGLADDDDKAFFVGLMLVLVSEYRQLNNPSINPLIKQDGLTHLLIIEEAHRLLKNVSSERMSEDIGNPKGKAVEYFCNVIAEMRSLGQGVIVVEQIPSKIAPEVIKNSNTKIVHRLVSRDDQVLLAGSLSLKDEDALYLNRLKTGFALCHKEGMEKPVEFKVEANVRKFAITDETIYNRMQNKFKQATLYDTDVYELKTWLDNEPATNEVVAKFINQLCLFGFEGLKDSIINLVKGLENIIYLSKQSIYQDFKEETLLAYTVEKLMYLLGQGLYRGKGSFPKGIRKQLQSILSNRVNQAHYDSLLKTLSDYWQKDAKEFITHLIDQLAKHSL